VECVEVDFVEVEHVEMEFVKVELVGVQAAGPKRAHPHFQPLLPRFTFYPRDFFPCLSKPFDRHSRSGVRPRERKCRPETLCYQLLRMPLDIRDIVER